MRRKYAPWILALSLSTTLPLSAAGEEITADNAAVSAETSAEVEDTFSGDDKGTDSVYNESAGVDTSSVEGSNDAGSEASDSVGDQIDDGSGSAEENTSNDGSEPQGTQDSVTEDIQESAVEETPSAVSDETQAVTPEETQEPAAEETQASEAEETQAPAEETQPSSQEETQAPAPEETDAPTPEETAPASEDTQTPNSEETIPSETEGTEESGSKKETDEQETEPLTLPEEDLLEDIVFDPYSEDEDENIGGSALGGFVGTIAEHEETETIEEVEWYTSVSDGGAGELYIAVHGYPVGDLTKNEKTIYKYLREELGLNKAAACGVLSNIYFESNFSSIAIGDGGTSLGLCQWHLGRCRSLMSWCESHDLDYRSIGGQLEYMKYELENAYSGVLGYLYGVPDTAEGAYRAGYYFCMYFESPDSVRVRSDARGTYAKVTYYPSDLDKYLKNGNKKQNTYKLDGQIDRVLTADLALMEKLLEEDIILPSQDDLVIQEIILEEVETEKQTEMIAEGKLNVNVSDGRLIVGGEGNTVSIAETDTDLIISDPIESVVLIPADASKPGVWGFEVEKAGFSPEGQAK